MRWIGHRRPREVVGCVHTAYLHIDPRMLTLVAGRCHGGLVCMASGREMAYCVLCVYAVYCAYMMAYCALSLRQGLGSAPLPEWGALTMGPGGLFGSS